LTLSSAYGIVRYTEKTTEMTMWFENMTYEEKYYRFLLRTGASSDAIADARDNARKLKDLIRENGYEK
jgi:hypothetical protein